MNNAKSYFGWMALVSLIIALCSCEILQKSKPPSIPQEVSQQVNDDPEVHAAQELIDIKTVNLNFWELEKRKSESIARELEAQQSGQYKASDVKMAQGNLLERFHKQRIALIERFLELEKDNISYLTEKKEALVAAKQDQYLEVYNAQPASSESTSATSTSAETANTAQPVVEKSGGKSASLPNISVKDQIFYTFNQSYLEYKENRPDAEPVSLNPDIWKLVPSVGPQKYDELNEKSGNLAVIYQASILFADQFFYDAELENFKKKKQEEWQARVNQGEFSQASVTEVEAKFKIFMNEIREDPEYKRIEAKMRASGNKFAEEFKNLSGKAVMAMIQKHIKVDELKSLNPPPDMSWLEKAKFTKTIGNEVEKAQKVLEQGTYTTMGTSLILTKTAAAVIITTFQVADLVVIVTAVDAAGKAVELIVIGGNYVVKTTGQVVYTGALLAEDLVRGVDVGIGNMLAVTLSEEELFDLV